NKRVFAKLPSKRAHYCDQTFDHEVKLDTWSWVEAACLAYRTDYDIRKHMQATGADLRVFKPYDSPIEKTVRVVKPNHDKIRKQFGADAGRISSLLAREDLVRAIQDKKTTEKVRIDSYEGPIEFLEAREEKVKETGKTIIHHVVEPSCG